MMVGRPFPKGVSGNPGGKPKGLSEVRDLARQHSTFAVEVLVKIAGNGRAPAMARVAAATQLLDRGFGRPPQSLEVQSRSPLADLSTAALLALAQRLADQLALAPAAPPASLVIEGHGVDGEKVQKNGHSTDDSRPMAVAGVTTGYQLDRERAQ